jgi:wyosine [tRNA(Phe)-imidazoG37] synthetase (radical SAM superfamily)
MVCSITEVESIKSIWEDLNSGMDCLPDLADIMTHIRLSLIKRVSFAGQLPETILQTLKSSTADSLEVEHILLSMSPLVSSSSSESTCKISHEIKPYECPY